MRCRSVAACRRAIPGSWAGRRLLARVRHLLGNGPVVLLPTAEHQLGGVGRTQLAVEYAHRYAGGYDLVWWIPAEQTAGLRAALVGLAHQLGLPEARDVNRTLGAVRDALSRGEPYRNWLVVFENANRPEDIKPYLPSGAGHVLVTSRNPRWTAEVAQAVQIGVFDRADSVDFVRRRTPDVVVADADRLAAHLADVPMALDQASAVRAATGRDVDGYLHDYDELAGAAGVPDADPGLLGPGRRGTAAGLAAGGGPAGAVCVRGQCAGVVAARSGRPAACSWRRTGPHGAHRAPAQGRVPADRPLRPGRAGPAG